MGLVYFNKPCFDVHYQLNYKLLYAQAGYMYNNGFEKEFYRSLNYISVIAGMQSKDDNFFTIHSGFGISYMTAKNHPDVSGGKNFLDDQFNPVFFVGTQFKLASKHFIALKFYATEFSYRFNKGYKHYYVPGIDTRLNICYLYKFGRDKTN